MSWIKFEDRKPEKGRYVLVYVPSFPEDTSIDIDIDKRILNSLGEIVWDYWGYEEVEYWMPLPNPPKDTSQTPKQNQD